ncbi:TapB family protein [Hymenobacter fodinae]|uniref:DUF3108 domain-containing protein n=1 Tax=Hymenobacter fodinae TaxID=2510796 RepID=A0A4Z0P2R7_9BACT|nr:hypothetical protein [Hymenobacter fodinae]TGE04265.1 hypothetical protein EU556_23650 [Hymenobacter fodinae]
MTCHSFLLCLAGTLVLAAPAATAQDQPTPPTESARPFGLTDRMEVVYQLQDAKGKPLGTIRNRVVNFGTEQNKKQTITTTTALIKSGAYDTKNKLMNLQDLRYLCRQDTCFTDGTSELNQESLRSFRDRRFSYEPVPLAWPTHPTVGTTLPSGGITVQVSSTAVDIAKVYTTIKNRKVVSGPETVTTPAGTFQCYKVESERESGTAARADLVMRNGQRMVDYYSPEVGVVKTEYYDKKGKLEQVRLLTMRQGSDAEATEHLKQKSKIKIK